MFLITFYINHNTEYFTFFFSIIASYFYTYSLKPEDKETQT